MTIALSVEKMIELPFDFMIFEDVNDVYFGIING